ncbi:CRISPR-associated endonuclease Cas2 [Candidatus Kaiserbacteria bacterium]|nr:CRISPR-associated endonuclease Cas2 [Candidatus Kaiserbacteria bacterium]
MGTLEEKSRKRAKRANIKMAILETAKLAGMLSLLAFAPNVISGLAKLGIIETKRREESIRVARSRMIRQGLLRIRNGMISLTPRGEKEFRKITLSHRVLNYPKKWDGKWRVLIFDIPNHRKSLRDKLRLSLKSAGFVRFQNSVWVFPYNCEDFVALLKSELKIGKDMQYLIVDVIENDKSLLETFKLE